MYVLPARSNYPRRSGAVNDRRSWVSDSTSLETHGQRVKRELREAGLGKIELWSPECRYLLRIIHLNEHIKGAVYGLKDGDLVLMVATDRRIIVLNKKPLFVDEDELGFEIVSGVSFTHAGPGSTVILHTRNRDYALRTLNGRAVRKFVDYIELECLEQYYRTGDHSYMSSPVPRFFK